MFKKPIERQTFSKFFRGRLITIILYKMEDYSYEAYAYKNFETDQEIVGYAVADEKETAVKLAINDLYIESLRRF